jgi:alpha-1,2-mannosyltransferase
MSFGSQSRSPSERQFARTRALALTLWLAIASVSHHWVAQDFSLAYYPAAHRLLDGGDPYAVTHAQIVSGAAFVYPALSAVVLAPLALVSSGAADHLYTLLCIVLVPGTLWVSGVRDWRVYGVTLLWYPIIIGWQGENISVPLMFLTALAWRHRDRPLVAGVIVAAAISMKPLLWPLGLWLLATRRWRAAAYSLASGLVLNLLAWGVVGFNQVSTYTHLAGEDTRALWRGGYSLLALAHHLGLGRGAGYVLLALAAAALVVAILRQGLVRQRERQAFVLAVALMLVASPLVWIHYFVLLLVPLAIARPRFGALWVVPVAMWFLPPATSVAGWQFALAWVLVGACVLGAFRDGSVGRWPAGHRPQAERPSNLATTG